MSQFQSITPYYTTEFRFHQVASLFARYAESDDGRMGTRETWITQWVMCCGCGAWNGQWMVNGG